MGAHTTGCTWTDDARTDARTVVGMGARYRERAQADADAILRHVQALLVSSGRRACLLGPSLYPTRLTHASFSGTTLSMTCVCVCMYVCIRMCMCVLMWVGGRVAAADAVPADEVRRFVKNAASVAVVRYPSLRDELAGDGLRKRGALRA
jgi:hypothetical protein